MVSESEGEAGEEEALNFVFSIFSLRRLRNSVQQSKPCLLQIGLENLNWVGKSIRKNTKN
jgi:hypothetical protein